jgi:MOSC domain-containing protein YiiM/acetylornithine deacetylase/succinyl-diaminopimelate desuccinylase-like protein
MQITGVFRGRVREYGAGEEKWTTATYREAVEGPVEMGALGLEGDEHADTAVHGGPDKAVLVCGDAHYDLWAGELGLPEFGRGALGENLTVRGLDERAVCLGDRYRLGTAVVEVSQPRQPCWKQARRRGRKDFVVTLTEKGRNGWYLRILEPGKLERGDEVELLERAQPEWTIARAADIYHFRKNDRAANEALAAVPTLAEAWRKKILARLAAVVLLFCVAPAGAQTAAEWLRDPVLGAALAGIEKNNAWTMEQQVSICEIAAPPFGEAARAREYAKRLAGLGMEEIRTDKVGNVISKLPGSRGAKPLIVFSAHLDTVFPEGMDVKVRKEGARLHGLGIGDDCRGLAVVLAVAKAFRENNVKFGGTVLFVATVGEEGQGDLRGVRHLFGEELKGKVDEFISVDGTGFRVTSRGVGSNRYKVTYKGRGGHSYGAFGMPNPAHAMGRAIARLADIPVPQQPKTTFNVGTVTGGTSVNSIPIEVSMELDLRSESAKELATLDERVRAALRFGLEEEKKRWPESKAPMELEIATMGLRPVGEQSDEAAIVKRAMEVAAALHLPVFATGAGSTDSNLPISLGIPAVTIGGGGRSPNAHSIDEWFEEGPDGFKGPQMAALLVAVLAGR